VTFQALKSKYNIVLLTTPSIPRQTINKQLSQVIYVHEEDSLATTLVTMTPPQMKKKKSSSITEKLREELPKLRAEPPESVVNINPNFKLQDYVDEINGLIAEIKKAET
jgi:hypothetical protein